MNIPNLTSPCLDERMKVSSPWLEVIEINEKVNTYVYFKRTHSAQSEAVKVILTLQISTINKIFVRGVHPLVQRQHVTENCILLNGCELDSQQF